jgi:hypothetical protein
MNELARFHLDACLGALLLGFVLYSKWVELTHRRRAVRVRAQVVKVFGHRHTTSYFVRYVWEGAERSAEWRGPPLRQRFQPGDELEILVDPHAPDVPIPEQVHNAPNAAMGSGSCSLADEPIWSWWDLAYAAAGVALILRSFR